MIAGPIASDAFRFLDIRGAKLRRAANPTFTIDRSLLAFPETPFEHALKSVPPSSLTYGPDMAAQLRAAGAPDPAVLVETGFLADLGKLEAILLQQGLAPETRFARFSAALPAAAGDQSYFISPTAEVWDKFLAATLMALSGLGVSEAVMLRLSSALRIAAAIFASKTGTTNNIDLAVFTIASIRIPSEVISPERLRATRPTRARTLAGDTTRAYQNAQAARLLELQAASSELRGVLVNSNYTVPALPAGPAAPGGPGGGGGAAIEGSITAQPLRVAIPTDRLSTSTRALLVREFGSTQQAMSVDNVDIVAAANRIDGEISELGQRLFGSLPPATILVISQQLALLEQELRIQGAAPTAKIARLGLLLSAPDLTDPGDPGVGPAGNVRVLGIGDLKVVKQTLLRYDAGEVANIENVLVGQTKERTHSVRQSTEETVVVEQEKSTSTEKDLQSTDRFEMAAESQTTIKEQRQNEAGITVSASYGPVSVSANTKFSDTSSQEQGSKISHQFARDVINKSVEKIEQKVREERTRKTTLEIEEINKYSQTASTKSVVGIYRWVNKVYSAQVNVYGKRMMLEFILPEPAAVYVHSKSSQPADPAAVKQPDPLTIKSSDIQRYNYAAYAARYGAEVEAPPPSAQLAKFANRSNTDTTQAKISLDDGWIGTVAGPTASWIAQQGAPLIIQIGNGQWDISQRPWSYQSIGVNAVGDIPLSITSDSRVTTYNVTGQVVAVPSSALFEKWQLATYKALAAAYQLRLSEYRDYLASQRHPEVAPDQENRDVERRELQRACIEILTEQHFDGPGVIGGNPNTGWPEIDFSGLSDKGAQVSFFQQSFEWEQMTYVFYPYFWARQTEWARMLSISGGDQLFTRFLTAGFARVVVPVRPAHESDVAFYLASGVLWGGTEPPVVGDPRYVAILDEIKESLDAPDGGVAEGDSWQVKVPTSLVILDDTGKLPSWPGVLPVPGVFAPSPDTCGGLPYNIAQWKDGKSIADAIRKLGYAISPTGDQDQAIRDARMTIRAMQARFNQLGAESVSGSALVVDGIVGACTLRALTYFDALRAAGDWPGVG